MEYRRRCTVCGKIYCYTSADLSDNSINSVSATISAVGALASLFGGTRLDTYALNSQTDRYSSKIINFEQCPNCHSVSTVLLSDEEWVELQKQSESSGGIAVKTIDINANATVESLLKRAYLFLEDAEWQTADAYFEKILDVDPENAQAYLGKLLAELRISTISELQTCDKAFEESANWQKALRFADEKLSTELQQYILEHAYSMGVSAKMAAQSEADYKVAAEQFNRIAGYRDADQLAAQCLFIVENEPKYRQAIALQAQDTEKALEQAVAIYEAIISYKDSAQNAEVCRKRIPVLQEELRQKERLQEEKRIATVIAHKKAKRIAIIAGIIAVIGIMATIVIQRVIIPGSKYKAAEELLAERDYDGATVAFTALGNYRDSAERAADVPYIRAEDMLDDGDYENAIEAFQALGDYKDAANRVNEIWQAQYNQANSLLESGDYEGAIDMFKTLGDFSDSSDRILEAKYREATEFLNAGDYDNAVAGFRELGDYADSADCLIEANYQEACLILEEKDYRSAISSFEKLADYKDATKLLLEAREGYYQEALALLNVGNYEEALSILQRWTSGYKDSEQQVTKIYDTVYADAFRAYNAKQYSTAYEEFTSTKEAHPSIVDDRINDYIMFCEVKRINFDDGNTHSLSSIYNLVFSIKDETLKNELMNLPVMKTLTMLQGNWRGKYHTFTIIGGSRTLTTGDSLSLVYHNGRYCTSVSYPDTSRYDEIYNISQNQFMYREHINNGYMNVDTCSRIG